MKNSFSFISVFVFIFVLATVPVQAADPDLTIRDDGFAATYVSQSESDPIILEAGETRLVKITLKNTGTKSWVNEGNHYISAYTMEPRERDSVFFGNGNGWDSPSQIGRMTDTIKPGEKGELGVFLHAPLEVGTYKEEFHLSAENWSWVDDGYFYLDINVVPKVVKEIKEPDDSKEITEVVTSTYEAKRIGLSKKTVEAVGGERIKIVAIYQNIGKTEWNGYSLAAGLPAALASVGDTLSFADHGWMSGNIILAANDSIAAGGLVRETFYFRAPRDMGDYIFSAGLAVDGTSLDQFDINVHVTENASLNYVAPTFSDTTPIDIIEPEKPRLEEEPRIRVGLSTKEQTSLQFVSYEDDYKVFNGDKEMGVLPKKKIGIFKYASGMYSFDGSDMYFQTDSVIRLEPVSDSHAVFTLMNVSRPMSWVGPGDFNRYRGILEYRIGETDGILYAVNDLLLDDYVKGISETGRNDQLEFVKANLTAARTYAYVSRDKYPFFDVLGSTYDQLYLGYDVEVHNPQVAQAAEASRGRMVTYKDEVVITPYFGNSNGYTKSWSSVWGGKSKPWLMPVKATYDLRDGRYQFGHGVGMSQRDANIRAREEEVDYIEILKYYYTGVEATLMYN
jgi:hypothetical protein